MRDRNLSGALSEAMLPYQLPGGEPCPERLFGGSLTALPRRGSLVTQHT